MITKKIGTTIFIAKDLRDSLIKTKQEYKLKNMTETILFLYRNLKKNCK